MADATQTCPRGPSQPWDPPTRARHSVPPDSVDECSWPTAPCGTPTRAIYAAALGGRCRPWTLYRWQINNGRWEIPDVALPPCRRGLRFCFCDDPDCRRSLAIAMACAEER